MPNSKSKFNWCLESEKRMKKIESSDKLSKEHIDKAKHNLKAADYNIQGHFDDWAVSQSYYAMYHALLAILFKKGFESKNHGCTISTVEFLIEAKEVNLNMEDLSFIRTTEQMTTKDAKSLREEFQYGTKTDLSDVEFELLKKRTKELFDKIKQEVEKNLK